MRACLRISGTACEPFIQSCYLRMLTRPRPNTSGRGAPHSVWMTRGLCSRTTRFYHHGRLFSIRSSSVLQRIRRGPPRLPTLGTYPGKGRGLFICRCGVKWCQRQACTCAKCVCYRHFTRLEHTESRSSLKAGGSSRTPRKRGEWRALYLTVQRRNRCEKMAHG